MAVMTVGRDGDWPWWRCVGGPEQGIDATPSAGAGCSNSGGISKR